MNRVDIKPLSVNECYRGRRFKTDAYTTYEEILLYKLPRLDIPTDKKLELHLSFGLSSKSSDIDNCVKCFVDCLQKKYGFNDKNIYLLHVAKVDVKKGEEFVEFLINEL